VAHRSRGPVFRLVHGHQLAPSGAPKPYHRPEKTRYPEVSPMSAPTDPKESPEARRPGLFEPINPPDESVGLPNKRQVIHAVIFNLTMLGELGFALYTANRYRDTHDFTLIFVLVFFGTLIPTIYISRQIMKRVMRED
jgi:hypothetical protein